MGQVAQQVGRAIGLLALLLPLTGCFEVEREVELCPDGSGHVVVRTAVHPALALLGKEADPSRAAMNLRGVRWEPATRGTTAAGWQEVRVEGYFAEATALAPTSFEVAPTTSGGLLVRRGEPAPEGAAADGPRSEQDQALLRVLLGSLVIRERIVLPGDVVAVTSHPWVRQAGRAVEVVVRGADLGAPEGAAVLDAYPRVLELECGPPGADASARAAAVRARWEALGAEAEALRLPPPARRDAVAELESLRGLLEELKAPLERRRAEEQRAFEAEVERSRAAHRLASEVRRVGAGELGLAKVAVRGEAPGWPAQQVALLASDLAECGLRDGTLARLDSTFGAFPGRWGSPDEVLAGPGGDEARLLRPIAGADVDGAGLEVVGPVAVVVSRFVREGAGWRLTGGEVRALPELLAARDLRAAVERGDLPVLITFEARGGDPASVVAALEGERRPRAVVHLARAALRAPGVSDDQRGRALGALEAAADALVGVDAAYGREALALAASAPQVRVALARALVGAADLPLRTTAALALVAAEAPTAAALDALRDGLAAESAALRVQVVVALGRLDPGGDWLAAAVRDGALDVLAAAIEVAVRRPAEDRPALLVHLLAHEVGRVRSQAAAALAPARASGVTRALLERVAVEWDGAVERALAGALDGRTVVGAEVIPALRSALAAERAWGRALAAAVAAGSPEADVTSALLARVAVEWDGTVQSALERAVQERGVPVEGLPTLREALAAERAWGRCVAAGVAGRCRQVGALAALLDRVAVEWDGTVQRALERALERALVDRAVGPEAVPSLRQALAAERAWGRRVAASVVTPSADAAVTSALLSRIAVEWDESVQDALERALRERVVTGESLPALREALAADRAWGRRVAAAAGARCADAGATTALLSRVAVERDAAVQQHLEHALRERVVTAESLPALGEALAADRAWARRVAAEAAARCADPGVVAVLERCLARERDPAVRAALERALRRER